MSDHSSPQAAPTEGAASPRLRDVLAAHQPYGLEPGCADTVAAAWHEACTVRSFEELDALPENATILVGGRSVLQRGRSGWYGPGYEVSMDSEDIIDGGCAIALLWHPGWAEA